MDTLHIFTNFTLQLTATLRFPQSRKKLFSLMRRSHISLASKAISFEVARSANKRLLEFVDGVRRNRNTATINYF